MAVADQLQETIAAIADLIEMGLLDQAEQLCQSVISTSGESAEMLNFLGVINHGKGRKEEALRQFQKAKGIDPSNEKLAKNVLSVQKELGVVPRTIEHREHENTTKVLLVNPHETEQSGFTNPPLGLLYLAGTLVKNGYDVRVTDGCIEGKQAIIQAIETFKPQIVGITCLTPRRKRALEVAQMVKDYNPSTLVVLGGAHPTIMFKQLLQEYPNLIDYVVLGEGEQTFLEIVQGKDPSTINGIAYLESGTVVKTPHREYVDNLDELPFPAWHLLDLKRYPARGPGEFRGIDLSKEPRISVIFSRGCTGHCSFCSTWWIWHGWRHRSAKNMVDELELLYTKYNIRHFCFADDTLTASREATIQLCDEIISRKLNIAFHVTTRTDCVDEEMLIKLRQAGCYNIAFGIETGSPILLERMGKENDIEKSEKAIRLSKKAGIFVTALIMVGNVGETEETVRETIDFLRRTKPDDIGCAGALWILPGTKVFFEAKKRGFIDDSFWLSDEPYKIYTLEWSLQKLNEFEHRVFNYNKGTYMIPTMEHKAQSAPSQLLDKWNRYVKNDVHEYSATSEWKDAQRLHLELFKQIPESCVDLLDLGCGDGWSTYQLSQMGKRVVGVTTNEEEARHAAKYGIEVVVQDMHDLKFPESCFDFIYCREVLEHSVAPYLALCEMNRVLRSDGYVLINLPWEDWIRDDSHFSVMTPSQIREMFYKTRFVVEREGRSSAGHYWYLSRKVAEIGEPHPYGPPKPGEVWALPQAPPHGDKLSIERDDTKAVKIIGMLRIKNEEKWIANVLEKASSIVDGFVILDDGSTDGTPEICRAIPKVLRYEVQQEDIVDEARDKNKLLKMALSYSPDWVLALDGDEVLEDIAPSAIHELTTGLPANETVVSFDFLYMWDHDGIYRFDGKYRGINHPRLFRSKGIGIEPSKLTFTSTQHGSNFHCGSVPSNMPGQVFKSDIKVKHYGYFEREQRESKKTFYFHNDPEHASKGYYDHLTDEKGIELLQWNERAIDEVLCLRQVSRGSRSDAVNSPDALEIQKRFDQLPQYYKHLRTEILNAVPSSAMNILDVGCGSGILGKALKEGNPLRTVTGVELNPEAHFFANLNLDKAYNVDVESFSPGLLEPQFDCIILADILEHLKDPWTVVRKLTKYLRPGGTVIASIPNIRNLNILQQVAEMGSWNYADEGILDRTHLRFFTKKEFMKLLEGAGITCDNVTYLGGDDLRSTRSTENNGVVRIGNLELLNVSQDQFEELIAFQILFVGVYQPIAAFTQEAMTALEQGKFEEAIQALERAIASWPNNPELRRVLATVLLNLKKESRAIEVLEGATEQFPEHSELLNDLGVLYFSIGNREKGVGLLEKSVKANPKNVQALKNLGKMYFDIGDLRNAFRCNKHVLEQCGDDVETLLSFGDLCRKMNLEKDAQHFYAAVLDIDPNNAAALERRLPPSQDSAIESRKSGFGQRSINPALPMHIEAEPDRQAMSRKSDDSTRDSNVESMLTEAEVLISRKEFAEAEGLLRLLIKQRPECSNALNDLAVVKVLQGEYEEGVELLRKVISIDPENQVAKENIQLILQKFNQVMQSSKSEEQSKEATDLEEAIARAEQSIQSKNYEEAEAILKRMLSSYPFNIDALNDLAVVEIMEGKTEDALQRLKQVLEIDRDNEVALGNLRLIEGAVCGQLAGKYRSEEEGKKNDSLLPVPIGANEQHGVSTELPLVSVIIPVFNQLEYTKKCVDAIIRNTDYPNYEVIIINNASTDGTKEYLDGITKEQTRYKVIHSVENLGFVKGCNFAAEQADGKYILFLNNDTEVQLGWLSSLVEFAESHKDCGAVGSKLVYPDGTLQEAGGIIFSDGGGWNYGRYGNPNDPAYNVAREVDYCSGASLLVRTELFSKYGGFDQRYSPAYSEDADLCFTLRKDGYRVMYNPKSVVVHYESITSGKDNHSGFKRYLGISRKKFIEKWKEELLLQDEAPSEDKFKPTTADRSRLLDDSHRNKFAYRKNYVFTGLKNLPENVLPYYPTLGTEPLNSVPVNLLCDTGFLLELAESYGLPWMLGRAYLEGRNLHIYNSEMSNSINEELKGQLQGGKRIVEALEIQQPSMVKDILNLELKPEPTRSLFFIKAGGRTFVGVNALKELYRTSVKYAILKGALDIATGIPEDEGMKALESLVAEHYTSNMELPVYVSKTAKLVRKFSYKNRGDETNTPLKVLCFYPHNPYPPRTGADHGFMGVLNVLQGLNCEVHLFSSTYFTDKPWKNKDIEQFCRENKITLYIHQADEEDHIQVSLTRLMGVTRRWDMKIPDNLHLAFAEVYKEVSPDIVLINYAWWGKITDGEEFSSAVKILQMHDLLSLNEKMQAAAANLMGQPPYDPEKVKPEALIEDVFARLDLTGDDDEYEIYDRYDYVLAVSDRETERITKKAPQTKTILIPAPLGSKSPTSRNSYGGYPLFAIANNIFNVQSYLYFVKKVLPLIRREIPDFQLNVIGDGCKVLNQVEGINLLGFVDDLRTLYQESCFAIAPMIGGTGQSVKILEAMANGLPVVSLKNSYQTSSVLHGTNGLAALDAKEFAEYTIRLYKDRDLCRALGHNARNTVREGYSQQKIVDGIKPVIESILSRKSRGGIKTEKNEPAGSRIEKRRHHYDLSTQEIIMPYVEKQQDNFIFISDSILHASQTQQFDVLEKFLNSLPPFFAHFGGIGDACLLLSTFYDDEPEQVILSFGNSTEAMKTFFKPFKRLSKVYLMNSPRHAGMHQLIRYMIHRTQKCKGMGTTPLYNYSAEWNSSINIFEKYGVKRNPGWTDQFKTQKIEDIQVTIQPRGSLRGMVGSKRNMINRDNWYPLIEFLTSRSIKPIIIGTPDERKEYPVLNGCIDERNYDLKRQMELVASSDFVIGADSWAKTLSALCSIPTAVFRPVRGKELAAWQDPADNVFIKPWQTITMIDDMEGFRDTFERITNNKVSVPVMKQLRVAWKGNFFAYDSGALINRQLSSRLAKKGREISIVPLETWNAAKELKADKRYAQIVKRISKKEDEAEVHIRNSWPPDLIPPANGHWVVIQPWEFGSLPKEWVEVFTKQVDETWVPSTYVRQVYIDSGVPANKVFVMPNGVDPNVFKPVAKPFPLKTKKRFKFLFVGGTIYRKGFDILLDAYGSVFRQDDDVCLVIKDFNLDTFYRGRNFSEKIGELQSDPNYPEIEYINRNLSDKEIAGLYVSCNVLVHPYRGEGFGIPILESMACGRPPIVTNGGAALDFCNEENSILVKASVVKLDEKHIGSRETVDYPWLYQVDVEDLKVKMKYAYEHPEELKVLGEKGSRYARENWTWERAAKIADERIAELAKKPIFRESAAGFDKQYNEAVQFATSGRIDDAIRILEELILIDPDNPRLLNDAGALWYQKGEREKGFEMIKRSTEIDSSNINSLKNVADIYLESGQLTEATKAYQEVLSMNPDDKEALKRIGDICSHLGNDEDAKFFYSKADGNAGDVGGQMAVVEATQGDTRSKGLC